MQRPVHTQQLGLPALITAQAEAASAHAATNTERNIMRNQQLQDFFSLFAVAGSRDEVVLQGHPRNTMLHRYGVRRIVLPLGEHATGLCFEVTHTTYRTDAPQEHPYMEATRTYITGYDQSTGEAANEIQARMQTLHGQGLMNALRQRVLERQIARNLTRLEAMAHEIAAAATDTALNPELAKLFKQAS